MYRNFIFLDDTALNDYYSVIKGGLTDGHELITKGSKLKSGGAKIKGIGGNLESESASELRETVVLTEAAKFNELYDFMESEEDVRYFDDIDDKSWETIKRRDMIEVEVSVKVSELYSTMTALNEIKPMFDTLEQFSGQSVFKNNKEKESIDSFMSMMDAISTETIPLICTSESNEKYKFIAELPKAYLKTELQNLDGEMTLLGKVQKIIPEDKEVEVYNMFSNLKALMDLGNKDLSIEEISANQKEDFIETVNGPAIKIVPLAIYR